MIEVKFEIVQVVQNEQVKTTFTIYKDAQKKLQLVFSSNLNSVEELAENILKVINNFSKSPGVKQEHLEGMLSYFISEDDY